MLTATRRRILPGIACALVALPVLTATPAYAYIGPGAGLTAIGTALALVSALFLAMVGFVWYPVRRLLRKRRATAAAAATGPAGQPISGTAAKADGSGD
ncbi:MAG TPA: hypothetical protein VK943_16390 [Arenibaculum sp.]|nr:hypothetical protein [Arenibaculum sp.]